MKRLAPSEPCPCGRVAHGGFSAAAANLGPKATSKASPTLTYGQCCGPWLEADATQGPFAPNAEQLMRSRYVAFVLEREAYLLSSWHPSRRPPHIEFDPGVKWLGLEVRDYDVTGVDTAVVEFIARHKPSSGPAVRLHERSRFLRDGDRWFYLDGTQY